MQASRRSGAAIRAASESIGADIDHVFVLISGKRQVVAAGDAAARDALLAPCCDGEIFV